jgi:hypothetical protein
MKPYIKTLENLKAANDRPLQSIQFIVIFEHFTRIFTRRQGGGLESPPAIFIVGATP